MSGHNRWAKLKRRKAVDDARRSKVWTKILKELQIASRIGGGDPAGNPRLRLAIDKARAVNMPKDRIKAAIEQGTGAAGGESYEEITYEGYGPGGAAILVEAMTDNRARTVADLRHLFERLGGNLGTTGSVAWMFKKRGIIAVAKSAADEDRVMEVALDAGATDVRDDGDAWTIDVEPLSLAAVQDQLLAAGIAIEHADVDFVPETRVALDAHKAETMTRLIDGLEDLDDVQNVYANHDVPDES
ncbi:MAG TPA: YebC/PmpR family DNA-binding transcriptional regulator [Kofleriaceae bacterium]|nr:YebC/PmpR family DNA-binding transcriptional regulator [Kofleriaceae bacterium]